MAEECLTEDLLARLLAANSPKDYLDQEDIADRKLSDYLFKLLDEKDVKRADVVRASGLHPTVVYDIFAGKSLPGRDNAIMLAFGLQCTLIETQRLLRLAGVSELWPKVRRDAVILWCVDHGMTREQCDDQLWDLGEKTLFKTSRLR